MFGAMTKNDNSTRYFSDLHEKDICKLLEAQQVSNSGAGKFRKGDVVQKDASLLVECKTTMSSKGSISIKKEWITKNAEEAFSNRLNNHCIAFNFEPQGESYFVIDQRLMSFLCEKLVEEENFI